MKEKDQKYSKFNITCEKCKSIFLGATDHEARSRFNKHDCPKKKKK